MAESPTKPNTVEGVLDIVGEKGGAFLRSVERQLLPRSADPSVSREIIRKFGLRGGELIAGAVAPRSKGAPGFELTRIESIQGEPVERWQPPTPLSDTTAIDPNERLRFDTPGGPITMRIVELLTPIGRGQRGLIVAPPRTGKTILLQQMAHGVATNHPDAKLIMLLLDERPEEVTEMRRNVRGEVIASSNDRDANSHVRLARLVIERCKRMVECGKNVVVFLDSITRLARAYNTTIGSSGRTMTGGLDIRALEEPKQIFGAARNVENGGSLTIIATALIETGSRADDFIFQEFKGTGNMELVLDRELANQRIWPAMNLDQSGTRKEEKLLSEDMLKKSFMLRRALADMSPVRRIQSLTEKMSKFDSLAAYIESLRA